MNEHYPFTNIPLRYGYDGLEPYIDAETMYLHHDKHLQGYIDNLNAALINHPEYWEWPLEQLIVMSGRMPKDISLKVSRNAGGVFNHFYYFEELSDNPTDLNPDGQLYRLIVNTYRSIENFIAAFKAAALSVFGSGYAWLVLNKNRALEIVTTSNQETPLPSGLYPLMLADVWEHAYYLKHYNDRAAYLDNFLTVLNWKHAEDLLFEKLTNK